MITRLTRTSTTAPPTVGPDSLDIRQRVAFNATYDLPWGKDRKWLTEGALSTILGGWNLGSIVGIQSGGPFGVNMNSNTTNAFSPGQRANVLYDPNLPNSERTVQRWFEHRRVRDDTGLHVRQLRTASIVRAD